MTGFTTSGLNWRINGDTPIRRVKNTRDPSPTDGRNFVLGDEWVNTLTGSYWKLSTNPMGGVLWVIIGGSGGTNPIDSVQVDGATAPGTNPVLPDSNGLITVTGAQVAPGAIGANVIKMQSLAANSYTAQIQQTSVVASKDTTKNGVAHFNSANFTNDQGFISLVGGGEAVDSFTTTVGGPVAPDGAGNVALTGASSTYTIGSVANTVRTEVQGTNHGVIIGQGTNTPATATTAGITGQLFGATTGADPAFSSSSNGDFTFTSSTAGSSRTLTVQNTDNTNVASGAAVSCSVGGTSAGDPYHNFAVGSARSYAFGIDNSSVSDSLVVSTASSASTTPRGGTQSWIMSAAGHRTLPLQPTCCVYVTTTQANVTGDGTQYTIIFDGILFDVGTNYNPITGIYTFAHTGRYVVTAKIDSNNFSSSHTSGDAQFVFTGGSVNTHPIYYVNPANCRRDPSGNNDLMLSAQIIDNFTAGQTVKVLTSVANGAKQVGIVGDNTGNPRTIFEVYLLG